MKTLSSLLIATIILVSNHVFAQTGGAAVNTSGADPDPSAILDVSSTTQGVLIPRLTESERLSMPNLAPGLAVYQTDGLQGYWVYNGSTWAQFPTVGATPGDMQYWDGTQWVMIPNGSAGQFLQISDTGLPTWVTLEAIGTGVGVLAVVTTDTIPVASIYATGASCGGKILNSGGTTVTDYGVCWSTSPNPTIYDNITWDGSTNVGNTSWTTGMSGLSPATLYYIRAYAVNAAGVSYGNERTFTTDDGIVAITTQPATEVGATFAVTGGVVTDYGGASITDFGICWSTSPSPDLDDFHLSTPGSTDGYESNIIGLTPGTTYYARAYATTAGLGTFYGDEITFTTNSTLVPAVGETYGGGIIFYVDGSGEHGLIVANGSFGSSSWGCNSSSVGATGTAIGTGASNTSAIVSGCATPGIPARVCDDLVHEGYNDWYLPSKDELIELFGTMYLFLHWNAASNSAWSSTEGSCGSGFGGACSAYYHHAQLAVHGGFVNKNSEVKIRPIRSF